VGKCPPSIQVNVIQGKYFYACAHFGWQVSCPKNRS